MPSRRRQHRRRPGHPAPLRAARPKPHQNDLHQRAVQRRPVPGRLDLRQGEGDHAAAPSPWKAPSTCAPLRPRTPRPGRRPRRPDRRRPRRPHRLDQGGIRNTFEAVPDAPVSKFTSRCRAARKACCNSTNICSPPAGDRDLTGQNGKLHDTEPLVGNSCKGKGKGKKRQRRQRGHGVGRDLPDRTPIPLNDRTRAVTMNGDTWR